MQNNLISSIILVILLSYLTSYITYFGFVSNYSINYFSKESYTRTFDRGIFRYRILSRYLLFAVYDILENNDSSAQVNKTAAHQRTVHYLDPSGNGKFYEAYFYLNTFFLMLTAVVAVLLLNIKTYFGERTVEKTLILFFIPVLINMTQFCIVSYDMIGYFLELLTLYVFLKFFNTHYVWSLLSICVLIIISTLNRESSLLTATLIITLIISSIGFSDHAVVAMISMVISFFITYAALHYLIAPRPIIPSYLEGNYRIYTNQLGVVFWLLFFYFSNAISNSRKNKKMITLYHLISLPYIVIVVMDGILWEVRLYVPLLLGSIFLARLDEEYLKFSLTTLWQKGTNKFLRKPKA